MCIIVEEIKEHTTTPNRALNDLTNKPFGIEMRFFTEQKVEKSVEIWATNVHEYTIVLQSCEIQMIPTILANHINKREQILFYVFIRIRLKHRQSSFKLRMVKTYEKRSSKRFLYIFVLCWIYWIYPCSVWWK